ncbi:MAG TPA: hypothetical protein VJC18_00035 [bacterium]|nr:hypothetical protein [bacterium]
MVAKNEALPKRAGLILVAIGAALIVEPEGLRVTHQEQSLITRCHATVREFPTLFRRGFIVGLYLFDLSVLFWGYGFKRFVALEQKKQQEFLDRCLQSRSGIIRNMMAGIRGLVMISYFSHPDVWKYIGYDPNGHVEERRRTRDERTKDERTKKG